MKSTVCGSDMSHSVLCGPNLCTQSPLKALRVLTPNSQHFAYTVHMLHMIHTINNHYFPLQHSQIRLS